MSQLDASLHQRKQTDSALGSGTARRPRVVGPASLLNARYRYVPFYEAGRVELLKDLEKWCSGHAPVSARLFHGAGGVGKTRLFIEWVERLRQRGWNAGFFSKRKVDVSQVEALVSFTRETPMLMVIDYAESQQQLATLLRVVARRRDGGGEGRLRVVLLARAPGDWWEDLKGLNTSVGALLAEREPTELSPLAPKVPQRQEVFRQAAQSFAQVLEKPEPDIVPTYLADARFERVLYVHMAALAEVEGLACDGEKLMEGVLGHEERFWAEWCQLAGSEAVAEGMQRQWQEECRQFVCALTLVGGAASEQEAAALQERACGKVDKWQQLLFHDIYPGQEEKGEERYVGWLEPDLLGEAMVHRALTTEAMGAGEWLRRVFLGQEARAVRTGFEVLGRISAGATEATGWIAALLEGSVEERALAAMEAAKAVGRRTAYSALGEELFKALKREGTSELAARLERAGIPEDTVSLREMARWVAEVMLRHFPNGESTEQLAERARLLNNLGNRLGEVGMTQRAMEAIKEAVECYRQLVVRFPEVFLANLAASLNSLGIRYSASGMDVEALEVLLEAVGYYRQLMETDPDTFLSDLARSLNNLGNSQSKLGRRRDALKSMQETVAIRRQLAAVRPTTFLPHLAMSLSNLGTLQGEMGLREAALVSAQEAVEHYRQLTETSPETFLPDLAMSLNNLGTLQGGLGWIEAALASVQEATVHYRLLAAKHPDSFGPYLAMGLNNLAAMLGDLGKKEEALQLAQEAVARYRLLTEAFPEVFLPDLAMSLDGLSRWQNAVGRRAEALTAIQESVEIYRRLAEQHPEESLPHFARSLNNLAIVLSQMERKEEAVAVAHQAVEHYRQLVTMNTEAFLPALAMGLSNLANRQGDIGREEEALAAVGEAVSIRRKLAAMQPEAFLPELAMTLNNLGKKQAVMGRSVEALTSVREALDILWPIFLSRPATFARSTGRVLQHLLTRFEAAGEPLPEEVVERQNFFNRLMGEQGS